MSGGMEAIYDDVVRDIGFLTFAPQLEARGAMFSARDRAHQKSDAAIPPPIQEADFYV